jgi:hypothetical protein
MLITALNRKNNFRQLRLSFLLVFVFSTWFAPIAHAQQMDSIAPVGASMFGFHAQQDLDVILDANLDLDHGHDHDDHKSELASQHSHDHNPADHSHDVPAVFTVFGQDLPFPVCTAVFARCGRFSSTGVSEIDRPPRS